jgi:serine/threonine protein kinase
MADIYLVLQTTDAGVDRYLVLKRVLAERARDAAFATMFLDEARLAAQLQHPNIAQVYDVGTLDGAYFFTMEYVHGEDARALLHRLAKESQRVPVNLALYIASGVLGALHHAHERTTPTGIPLNVVHRDVTPSNVMLSYEGAVKLLDFGVAKASERSTESRSGAIKGKIAYLSPEQCRGLVVDRRSDLFSLGIVMYELLTGKRLFNRVSDFETMLAITGETLPPPSTLRPELSPEIDRIVMKALAREREDRYASAAAMLEDVETLATQERHMLTASALGKFMRDVFGTKPEPWVKLPARQATAQPLTVTRSTTEPLGPRANPSPVVNWGDIQHQLEVAPILEPSPLTPTPDATSDEGGHGFTAPMPAVSAPIPAAPRKTSGLVIALATLAAIAAAAVLVVVVMSGPSPSPAPAVEPSAIAAAPAPAPTPTPAPATVDAATPASPPRSATIGDAVAAGDAAEAVRLCTTAKPRDLGDDDRVRCGVAACNAKQRALALTFHRATTGSAQAAIARACRDHGIALVQPAAVKQPASDPCKDPAYLDANPLKCQ